DPKAIKYILISYRSNQYRILNPRTGKIAWARDLDIVEDIPDKAERKDLRMSLKASIGPQKAIDQPDLTIDNLDSTNSAVPEPANERLNRIPDSELAKQQLQNAPDPELAQNGQLIRNSDPESQSDMDQNQPKSNTDIDMDHNQPESND